MLHIDKKHNTVTVYKYYTKLNYTVMYTYIKFKILQHFQPFNKLIACVDGLDKVHLNNRYTIIPI